MHRLGAELKTELNFNAMIENEGEVKADEASPDSLFDPETAGGEVIELQSD